MDFIWRWQQLMQYGIFIRVETVVWTLERIYHVARSLQKLFLFQKRLGFFHLVCCPSYELELNRAQESAYFCISKAKYISSAWLNYPFYRSHLVLSGITRKDNFWLVSPLEVECFHSPPGLEAKAAERIWNMRQQWQDWGFVPLAVVHITSI